MSEAKPEYQTAAARPKPKFSNACEYEIWRNGVTGEEAAEMRRKWASHTPGGYRGKPNPHVVQLDRTTIREIQNGILHLYIIAGVSICFAVVILFIMVISGKFSSKPYSTFK